MDFGGLNCFLFGEPIDGFGSQRSTRSSKCLLACKSGNTLDAALFLIAKRLRAETFY